MAGGIRSDDDDDGELSEINITPFIDVMLVLLIIFMVAAPLSTVDVPVDLPVSSAKPKPRPDKPLFLTLKADRTLAIGEAPTSLAGLVQAMDVATVLKRDTQVFVRADKSVPYGELMRVLNQLRLGGYLKVALVGLEETRTDEVGAAGPTPGAAASVPFGPAGSSGPGAQ